MDKDLSTIKKEKVVDRPEKGSPEPEAPTLDWLSGVQDGLSLFLHEYHQVLLKLKNPKDMSLGEFYSIAEGIAEHIRHGSAEQIASQYTLRRLRLHMAPSELTAYVHNLDR